MYQPVSSLSKRYRTGTGRPGDRESPPFWTGTSARSYPHTITGIIPSRGVYCARAVHCASNSRCYSQAVSIKFHDIRPGAV